ncbi:MAG: NAD(P)/FAD-dependent oxidoreductase [Lachnospiraceae bacterium]
MKVGIIGGGAAGMTAAITSAWGGHEVTVLEHGGRVGKKLLLTGNGKCNLTNVNQELWHYHGSDPLFADRIFQQCSYTDSLAFFTKLGIYTKNKNGCLYPYSEQASAVLEVLRMALKSLGVTLLTDCHIKSIKRSELFQVKTNQGCFMFDRLILAAGSKAAPQTGSDGSGYVLAQDFGHHIVKPLPALVQLRSAEPYFKQLAGIRTEVRLTILCDGKKSGVEKGELQLTSYGISGIPTFQLSHIAAKALDLGQKVDIFIDWMPDMESADGVITYLKSRVQNCPDKKAGELLIGMLHKNLNLLLIKMGDIKADRAVNMLTDAELKKLSLLIKQFPVPISAANSFQDAQICSGGVDTSQLKETLESTLVKGLYFAGELIDIHGDCGGYNLQWAWSSGMVAGRLLKS